MRVFQIGDEKVSHGHISIYLPEHQSAPSSGWMQKHRVIAEKALGRKLPLSCIVHHADEIKQNNSNKNLVICQDMSYHNLLHQRNRALKACGNANYRKCTLCHKYDKTENLNKYLYHDKCKSIVNKRATEKRKKRKLCD